MLRVTMRLVFHAALHLVFALSTLAIGAEGDVDSNKTVAPLTSTPTPAPTTAPIDTEDFDVGEGAFSDFEFGANETIDGENAEQKKPSFLNKWIVQPSHLSLNYGLGFEAQMQAPILNRTSARLQWERGFGDAFFARIDTTNTYDLIYKRQEYSSVEDEYLFRHRLREAYIQRSMGAITATLGKQIVIWGKADSGVVLDEFSPRDLTNSVFTEVEDARFGQNMLVVDAFYYGDANREGIRPQHSLTFIFNPDLNANVLPLPGHPYGPPGLGDGQGTAPFTRALFSSRQQDFSLPDAELGLRYAITFNKLDLAIVYGDLLDNNPIIRQAENPISTSPSVATAYRRFQMLGAGLNLGHSNFVWKAELAFKQNRSFNDRQLNEVRRDMLDLALGFDYGVPGLHNASFEVTQQRVLDWQDTPLLQREKQSLSSAYLVLTKNWWRETLTGTYTSGWQLEDGDAFHRIAFEYAINDLVRSTIQIDYFDVDNAASSLGLLQDKHRLALFIQWDI